MLQINFSRLMVRKVVPQQRQYTLVQLNNQNGVYVVCGGGVSQAGDVWFSARPVMAVDENVYVAGRASHQYWENQIANSWTVPVSAVSQ